MTEANILRGATKEELDAFVQVVVLVAYADGDLSSEEENLLRESVLSMAEGRVDEDHLSGLMEELPPLSRSSNNWRATRIAALRPHLGRAELREGAFRLAVRVARTDDKIGLREGRMLVNIVEELGIDAAVARSVLDEK